MAKSTPTLTLNSGHFMPVLGLGTWKSKPGQVRDAVACAIDVGYRHIDCAYIYGNENEVGEALIEKLSSGAVKREDLFVVSKLWNTRHSANDVMPSCKESLTSLGLDYLDLYLMHWPTCFQSGKENFPRDADSKIIYSDVSIVETWKAMENLVKEGLVRSIGVSNFNSKQLQEVLDNCSIKPAVNQVELHPYLSQEKLTDFCAERGIVITAYSPFGSPDRPWASKDEPVLLDDPKLKEVSDKYSKTSAQIILRWLIQRNIISIPKSVTPSRIEQNFNVFDFELSTEDMKLVSSFNRNERLVVPYVTNEQGKREFRDKDAPNFPFNDEF